MKTMSTPMTMIRGEVLRLSDAAGCTLRVQAFRLEWPEAPAPLALAAA